MDCSTARELLNTGTRPSSHTPQQVALGFHLATCAACRAHRTALDAQLLNTLLEQSSPPVSPPTAPRNVPLTASRARSTARQPLGFVLRRIATQTLWYVGLALLATFGVVTLVIVGSVARSIVHIHENVHAMVIPTQPAPVLAPPATPLATPSPAPTTVPTSEPLVGLAPPLPTPTPRPTLAPTITALPTATAPESGAPVNVLLLGVDRRPGETAPSRTDAIMIARIDPQNNRVALLSLPRDLVVPIPGFGRSRINGAHALGERYATPGGGAELSRKTVSNLLGIPIDYYVLIDFQGFIKAIDSIGGVSVQVDHELYDPQFPTMDYGYMVAHFLPGPQQLDGATALVFSRIRHSDSDFARIRRQQQVIQGVVGKLRVNGARERVESLEALTSALRGYVQTNMPEERIIGLAWALRELPPEQIERYTLRAEQVSFGVGLDRWAEVAKPGAIEGLVARLLGNT